MSFSRGKTLYVGGSGEGNYTSIQDAINDTVNGDTVFVYGDSSPYYENVAVDKTIDLIGENRNTTIIDGDGHDDVVYVSADSVSINRFTIQNSGEYPFAAINVHSDCSIIIGNNVINTANEGMGIKINSSYNVISRNFITNVTVFGISMWISSHNNVVCENNISNTLWGIDAWGWSNNNIIVGNNISRTGCSISLWDSFDNNINNNTVTNNDVGILISHSNDNTIIANIVKNNRQKGICLEKSSSNNISQNNIENNKDFGIELKVSSNDNLIYHNNFIENTQNAYDGCNNIWDDGKYGNYWSDYKEKYPFARKILLKGIWNTPYEIPGGDNKDRCPLIKQWPNLKPRTISRNTALFDSMFMRFSNLFPILQRLLIRLGLQ